MFLRSWKQPDLLEASGLTAPRCAGLGLCVLLPPWPVPEPSPSCPRAVPAQVPAVPAPLLPGDSLEGAAPAQGLFLASSASAPERPAFFLAWVMYSSPLLPEDEE